MSDPNKKVPDGPADFYVPDFKNLDEHGRIKYRVVPGAHGRLEAERRMGRMSDDWKRRGLNVDADTAHMMFVQRDPGKRRESSQAGRHHPAPSEGFSHGIIDEAEAFKDQKEIMDKPVRQAQDKQPYGTDWRGRRRRLYRKLKSAGTLYAILAAALFIIATILFTLGALNDV